MTCAPFLRPRLAILSTPYATVLVLPDHLLRCACRDQDPYSCQCVVHCGRLDNNRRQYSFESLSISHLEIDQTDEDQGQSGRNDV